MYVAHVKIDSGENQSDMACVARVQLFRKEQEGKNGLLVVDPRYPKKIVCFVRVEHLGPLVAFGPVYDPGDDAVIARPVSDYWNRQQNILWVCHDPLI
jgi:hypothetical protein